MGEARAKVKKKDRFFQEHPICCFCGGKTLATTIDHVPNRASFKGRAYPDTYEFPACDACQNASRKAELAFAFAVKMLEFDENNHDPESWSQMISGLVNNFPSALPNPFISGNAKRRGLANLGFRRPEGMFMGDVPVTHVPEAMNASLIAYAKKISVALWYREKRTIAPSHYLAYAFWKQSVDATISDLMETTMRITPIVRIGQRSNLDFGNRFIYRCNFAFNPDILLVAMQFGKSIVASCVIAEPKARDEIDFEEWCRLDEIFSSPLLA